MTQTPAGWFSDPQLPGQLRYWDGAGWTAHTQPGAPVSVPLAEGAIAALVLGVLSVAGSCGFLTGVPAMVVGRRVMRAVDESGGRLGGKGLAQAGFWTGFAGTVIAVLVITIGVVAAVVTRAG